MARIEDGATSMGQQPKPRWRTPELTHDTLVDATNIDNTPSGNDGVISSGVPLGQTS